MIFFVEVNVNRYCLWRGVDHEGEVLEAVVTKRRNKQAALKFLKKFMKRHGKADRRNGLLRLIQLLQLGKVASQQRYLQADTLCGSRRVPRIW